LAAVAVTAIAIFALFFEARAKPTALPPSTPITVQPVMAAAPPAEIAKTAEAEASTPQATRPSEAVPSASPRPTAARSYKSKTEQQVLDAISTRN
jgi:hypothetical protein